MARQENITVLYVDDEKDNLFVFKANFGRKFKVITTTSPQDALNELESSHDEIIVVISDMRMPEMSGVDFIRTAKAKYSNIYYCILTGYGYNDEIQQALDEDVIHKYFQKPFDVPEIEATILEVAHRQN